MAQLREKFHTSYGASFSGVAFFGDNIYEAPKDAKAKPTATTNITSIGSQFNMFPPYL